MDTKLASYEKIIVDTLRAYAEMFNSQHDGLEAIVITDLEGRHYQLLNLGWRKEEHHCYIIFHFDIKEGKVWLQENRTDILIAQELVDKGIAKSDIVLGFQWPEVREEAGYAAA